MKSVATGFSQDNARPQKPRAIVVTPEPPTPAGTPAPKRLNSFQILGAVLSAAGGVRGISKRGSSIADASTGAILGAILIFCAVLGLGLYAFVHAIEASVAS